MTKEELISSYPALDTSMDLWSKVLVGVFIVIVLTIIFFMAKKPCSDIAMFSVIVLFAGGLGMLYGMNQNRIYPLEEAHSAKVELWEEAVLVDYLSGLPQTKIEILGKPVFNANGGSVVLNDGKSGALTDITTIASTTEDSYVWASKVEGLGSIDVSDGLYNIVLYVNEKDK